MNKNGYTSLVVIISLLSLAVIAFLNISKISPQFPIIFLLALIIFVIAFIKTDVALIILILSMLLSPEFKLGGVSSRDVVVRADDVFLFVIFFGWLAKMAVNKELGLLRITPLNRPILVYVFICLIATGLGIFQGYAAPQKSFFYLLKYFEYFLLFFMVSNNIKNIKQVKMFLFFLLLTCFIVSVYAWKLHLSGVSRVAAPFDVTEAGGEANTLAGYLLLMIAVVMGLILYSNSIRQRIPLSGFLCFMVPPFLFTLSRGAWLGFFSMYVSTIILTKRARHILLICLLIIIILSPILLPEAVQDRITSTFTQGEVYTVLGKQIRFEESGAARIETWKHVIEKWYKRPILGYGITGAGFIDSQYARVLGETGLIGLLAFVWLMATIYWEGIRTLNLMKDDWTRGLTLGFLAGFAGLLFQSFSASTFIIVRIMEPFWFLTAIVVMLPEITASSQKEISI